MNARQTIDAAAVIADQAAPYFATARAALRIVETNNVPTMAVDTRGRLYYNPHYIATLTPAQTAYILIHETLHLLRDHAGRRAAIAADPRI
jgi:predicted metal-dependent peptidase